MQIEIHKGIHEYVKFAHATFIQKKKGEIEEEKYKLVLNCN